METKEAPKKVFIRPSTFIVPWPPYVDENSNYGGIEYTRTDAFIEKACEWLLNNVNYYIINDKTKFGVDWLKVKAELFDDFKKAMEE